MRNIRTRRARRFVGAALALLMAFASVVAAAHACTFRDATAQGFADAAATGGMPNCDDVPANAGAAANACALHCTSGNLVAMCSRSFPPGCPLPRPRFAWMRPMACHAGARHCPTS
jgi:hypothetical protein